MILVELDKVLEVFRSIHPLDYNAQAYKSRIEQLKCYNLPKGEWEKHKRAILYAGAKEYMGVEYHECSNCKQDAEVLQAGGGCELLSNYGPHCGADMRGDTE